MRRTIKYITPTCSTGVGYKALKTGAYVYPLAVPITQAWTEPLLVERDEMASELLGGNRRAEWNDFEHYVLGNTFNRLRGVKIGVTNYDYGSYMHVFDMHNALAFPMYGMFGTRDYPTSGLPVLRTVADEQIIADPVGLSTMISNSLKAMLPGIKPELSLVNSVIELKDFKTLPRTLKRIASFAKRGKHTLRRILGGGSDAYLQSEFNIKPLLSDIAGYRRALANVKKQVDKLLELERKKLVRHYNVSLGSPYVANTETSPNLAQSSGLKYSSYCGGTLSSALGYGYCKSVRTTTYDIAQFHAEIEYTYYLSNYDKQNAYLKGLMDGLGVNLNPSIIWNAIPWSFVVDWVIGIGRWLDQFKLRNLEPVTVIHRYLWSTTINRKVTMDYLTNVTSPDIASTVRMSTCSEHAYKRKFRQVSFADLTTSGFSLKEFTLAGALALSRHRTR